MIKIEPVFQTGDYIAPIKKSIYCDFEKPSLIKDVNRESEEYIIQTKNSQLKISFMMQDFYKEIIPNKQEQIK